MNHARRRAVVALAALAFVPAYAQEVQVLTLRHRRAEDVIPMLRPYLDPAGKLSGQGSQLQVQTTLQNLAQIRQLLATLDRPLRWLTIAVRQDRPPSVAGEKRTPHGAVVTDSRGAAAPADHDGARINRVSPSEERVRVLEDSHAAIRFESAVPMTFRRFVFGKEGVSEVRGTVTYDTLLEFLVKARLAGTAVMLEIEPRESAVSLEPGQRARLSTTAHGRLGEWIAVGGAELRDEVDGAQTSTGGLRAQTRPVTDQRGVWLKVELEDGAR